MRDRAALLALATEAGGREGVAAIVGAVRDRLVAHVDETTTQEQAWLVLAAHALGGSGELAYSVDGDKRTAKTDPVVINPDAAAVARGVKVKNEGDQPFWLQVTARGVPKEPLPAATKGLSIERSYFTFDGDDADLAKVRQNDRLIVSLAGLNLRRRLSRGGAARPPAGRLRDRVGDQRRHGEVLPVPAQAHADPHDRGARRPLLRRLRPRHAASIARGGTTTRTTATAFHVAYIVRAVTPGRFALPAVNVSDMYAPRIYGRTRHGPRHDRAALT